MIVSKKLTFTPIIRGLFLPLMAVADDWYKGGTLHEAKGYEWIAKDYADQIGADYYCHDAMDDVKVAKEVLKTHEKQPHIC